MKWAQQLYSLGGNGLWVPATDIRSRSEAVDEGPFFDALRQLVNWVNGTTGENGRKISSYFRHGPEKNSGSVLDFEEAIQIRAHACNESPVHRKAKTLGASLFTCWLNQGRRLPWWQERPKISDFPLIGNLLANVTAVELEYPYLTPFGVKYKFDIALVATVKGFKNPVIIAVVEFELTHRLDAWKVFLCKSLGFPVLSINLHGVTEKEITEEWLFNALRIVPSRQEKEPRPNHLFLPPMLCPLYLDIPSHIRSNPQHQYLVSSTEQNLDALEKALLILRTNLDLSEREVRIERVLNLKEDQMEMGSESALIGLNQSQYHSYLRISLDVPLVKEGNLGLYHVGIAGWLASRVEGLVVYKYISEAWDWPPTNPIWCHGAYKIAPKYLSCPLPRLKEFFHLPIIEGQSPLLDFS